MSARWNPFYFSSLFQGLDRVAVERFVFMGEDITGQSEVPLLRMRGIFG